MLKRFARPGFSHCGWWESVGCAEVWWGGGCCRAPCYPSYYGRWRGSWLLRLRGYDDYGW